MFPTLVYKTPGTHARAGGTYNYMGVTDPAALEAALADGWFLTLPEAVAGIADEPVDDSAPTRKELEDKASEMNIQFDGRTTDKKLAEKIEAALGDQE